MVCALAIVVQRCTRTVRFGLLFCVRYAPPMVVADRHHTYFLCVFYGARHIEFAVDVLLVLTDAVYPREEMLGCLHFE